MVMISFVEDLELQDLSLLGFSLSFFNCGPLGTCNCLNRFLLSFDVGGRCYNVLQRAVFKFVFDYIP